MISLPLQLTPSELLWDDDIPPFINQLLQTSRHLRREGEFQEASRCARDAMKAGQKPAKKSIQAIARMHLADARREMGRPGPALDDSQKAYYIFQRQPSRYQRHNEALATYSLGVIHQLLGNDMDALKWYQQADVLFDHVKPDWESKRANDRISQCTRVQCWMRKLCSYLTSERARKEANLDSRVWCALMPTEDEAKRENLCMAELMIKNYVIEDEMLIRGQRYRVHPIDDPEALRLRPGNTYYISPIPEKARGELGAAPGDYAFVVRQQSIDREGPGLIETKTSTHFGAFKRDEEGHITFVDDGTRITIGDATHQDACRFGHITARLTPIGAPNERSESPPPEPSSEPSASPDGYETLVRLVRGDGDLAERLIQYERQQAPDADRETWIENAIERIQRDNR